MKDSIILGSLDIGFENIHLCAREGDGGDFITNPNAAIFVGISDSWHMVKQSLLHEAMEFTMFRMGCRFLPDDNVSGDTACYHFMFDHAKFSSICDRVTRFLISAVPLLKTEFDNYHNPRGTSRLKKKRGR